LNVDGVEVAFYGEGDFLRRHLSSSCSESTVCWVATEYGMKKVDGWDISEVPEKEVERNVGNFSLVRNLT